MAKFTLRIDKKLGLAYFPKEIRQEGFVGEVHGFPNARTFTLIRPGRRAKGVLKWMPTSVLERLAF
jgi:hypothetical protein